MDAEFRLYDAMLAICKSYQKPGGPLATCYAKISTLANAINRSKEQVRAMARKLESMGWIENLHPDQQRGKDGRFETGDWRVLEHDDFLKAHPDDCPPLRYNPETDDPLTPGEVPPALGRTNVRRILGPAGTEEALPEAFVEVVRQSLAERAATGNPVPVADTGNPARVYSPPQEILCRTATGNPVAPAQDFPSTGTGNPVASLRVKPDTHQPTNPSLGGLEDWLLKNYATMGACKEGARQWLNQMVEDHSESIVIQALEKYLHRPSGFAAVKNPWGLFKSESETLIEVAKRDAAAAKEKAANDVATEALVQQQMREHAAFMEYEPPKPSEGDPDEYFDG
jgi:hypothetical protein